MTKYSRSELIELINKGRTLKEIGGKYGVTRQRMYQVLAALDIPTLEKQRKNQLTNWTEREKWAWKIISTRLPNSKKSEKLDILRALDLPDTCPVLGIPLDYSFGKVVRNENSPSIDQIKPGEGYQKENMIVISWRANRIKNDGTPEEHRKIADFYKT
jgi:hypothetical protein